ncbi:MAG: hypothetical protein V7L31_29930 [Nostoc sp.]|uniref:hypothetical protein n=1 Tax=Nostoc sp. TaxID=1180 RepID=UPI002FF19675
MMRLHSDLLGKIELQLTRLKSTLDYTYKSKAKANDLFEAFIFTILLDAAIRENVNRPIQFEDTSGNITSDILFRRSPGYINYQKKKYTHAVLIFPTKGDDLELEVHLGIYAVGSSKVPQECDIAVLLRTEGKRCRNVKNKNSIVVKSTNIVIGVECKCHESSKVALGSGRSFLGLVQDFSSNGKYFFVFNNEKPSVEKMLSHYDKGWEHNLSPTSIKEIDRLRNLFQDRFKILKAKVEL